MIRHVIIGMGVAGISAAETLRELDPSALITMVCDDPDLYYSRPGLAYYLTGEVTEKQLFPFDRQDWKTLNVRILKAHAAAVDPNEHLVILKDAPSLPYDRLLLATGAASASISVPGEDMKGIVKLDDMHDVRRILSLAGHFKSAVVVGGGVASIEMVEGLIARGAKVHYFLRGERYWSNVLDEPESRIVERRLKQDGVEIHYKTEIESIRGRMGKVEEVRTKNGETIQCQIIGTCIGVRPRTELARSGGLNADRGILTNEFMQTSDPDIFAAGDAAQVFDPHTRKSIVDSLWNPGRMQGRVAALNMAGQKLAYDRKVDVNVVRLAGVMISIIGAIGSGRDEDLVSVARGSSETWQQLPNSISTQVGNELNHLRLMVGERTLVGGLVLGDQKLSIPLQEMVGEQIDITPIRSKLMEAGPALGQTLMDFWTGIREIG